MRLWGETLEALRIASGTIYNQVAFFFEKHGLLITIFTETD